MIEQNEEKCQNATLGGAGPWHPHTLYGWIFQNLFGHVATHTTCETAIAIKILDLVVDEMSGVHLPQVSSRSSAVIINIRGSLA